MCVIARVASPPIPIPTVGHSCPAPSSTNNNCPPPAVPVLCANNQQTGFTHQISRASTTNHPIATDSSTPQAPTIIPPNTHMNDRAIHHAHNGQQQQSLEVGAQQSPPPTTTTESPEIANPTPVPPVSPLAVPPSRIPNAPYMALFCKEYYRLAHVRIIAAWKLSVEKKRLESYSGLTMSLSPGKPPPSPGPSNPGSGVPGPSLIWYALGPSMTRRP